MFVPFWLFYLISGTVMAVLVLLWALRTRQFDDQDRARYLPLAGVSAVEPSATPSRRRLSYVAVGAVLLTGGLALLTTLAVVLQTLD